MRPLDRGHHYPYLLARDGYEVLRIGPDGLDERNHLAGAVDIRDARIPLDELPT